MWKLLEKLEEALEAAAFAEENDAADARQLLADAESRDA